MSYYGTSTKKVDIEDMLGKVFTEIIQDDETITFVCPEGTFKFEHNQDCCENVYIESVVGDLHDLIGSPLLIAVESSNSDIINGKPKSPESHTWTFYKFATVKGWVDVRWLGESNGYYSESVELYFTPKE